MTRSDIRSDLDSRLSSNPPSTPRRATHPNRFSKYEYDQSDYSSYVSPSRRPVEERKSSGLAGGFFGGLGMGWFAKKLADRRTQKDEQRQRDEEDMRSGTSVSRFTGDGHPSPTRKPSRRPPPQRRGTGYPAQETVLSSEMTESTIESRPPRGNYIPPTEMSSMPPSMLPQSTVPPPSMPTIVPVPASGRHPSRSRHSIEHVSMPAMPPDPQGILAPESDLSAITPSTRPQRSRQGRLPMGTDSDIPIPEERIRYSSPSLSVKLKVHDDRDRNVTLRRLTEEEAAKARGRRGSESSISGLDSPTSRRYRRREASQRRAESAAERRAEEEESLDPLSPPNPAFAKTRRGKDSAYYSGQPQQGAAPAAAPTGSLLPPIAPSAGQTVSSLGSMGEGEWTGSPSPPGPEKPTPAGSAADNRRRRRAERRRASSAGQRPSADDMYD